MGMQEKVNIIGKIQLLVLYAVVQSVIGVQQVPLSSWGFIFFGSNPIATFLT